VVVYTYLWDSSLLQVWHVIGPTCSFSLDIKIPVFSDLFLAPNSLTVISYYGIYSWNHDTAQFDSAHFTNQEHLDEGLTYSPDRRLFICCSCKDKDIRVWDTQMGQLCGKPITMLDNVKSIALSPTLNHQSLGN